MPQQKPTICLVIPDSNEISGASNKNLGQGSPFFHPAFHTLLAGLKAQDDFVFEIAYGKRNSLPGEDRWDGCLHYKPVPYQPMPIPGMGGGYLGRTLALLRHIRHSKPVLVHGQGTEREAGLVAALSGFPSILTLHGNFRELSKTIQAKPLSYYWLAAMVESFCIPRVTAVHCLSGHAKRSVTGKARQTWIIPNAVDPRFFQVSDLRSQASGLIPAPPSVSPMRGNDSDCLPGPSPRPRVQPLGATAHVSGLSPQVSGFPILCVGAITEWKNPTLLIEAGDRIRSSIPDLQIHFVGSINKAHHYGANFMDLVRQRPWCHHHAHCSSEELIIFYQKAACCVVPSIQDNCPTVVLESMACGIPCIGSSAGGIPDLIENEVTGWLFDSGDADQLAEKLLLLHRSPAMSDAVAARAREHVKTHHSAEAIATAHLEMYRSLIGDRR